MTDECIHVAFAKGPNELLEPVHADVGTLLSVRNARYDADGQVQVRYGVTQLGTHGMVQRGSRMATFAQELVTTDTQSLFSWGSDAHNQWELRDVVSTVGVRRQPIFNATGSFQSWGEAISRSNSVRVVAWVDLTSSLVRAAVYDLSTGACFGPVTLSGTLTCLNVQVYVIGSTAIVCAFGTSQVSGAYPVYAWTLAIGSFNATWSLATNIADTDFQVTHNPSGPAFGVTSTATLLFLAYESTSGGGVTAVGLKCKTFNTSLSVQSTTTILNATINSSDWSCLAARGNDGDNIWVCGAANTTTLSSKMQLIALTPSTLALHGGPFAVSPDASLTFTGLATRIGIEIPILGSALVMCSAINTGSGLPATMFGQYNTAGLQGKSNVLYGLSLAAGPAIAATAVTPVVNSCIAILRQPYSVPGAAVAGAVYPGSYFVVDMLVGLAGSYAALLLPQLLGIVAPRIVNQAADPTLQQVQTPNLVTSATGIEVSLETVLPIVRGAAGRQGLELITVEAVMPYQWSRTTLGKELYLSGSFYDGSRVCELGFPINPQTLSITNNGGAGSTYNYAVTFARVNAQGNLEESAPWFAGQITSGAPPNVTLKVPCCTLTQKQRLGDTGTSASGQASLIYVLIYRTPATSSGNTTYYRVTTEPFASALQNTVNGEFVNVTDNGLSDATLTTQPILYTVGGELARNCPESFTHVTTHQGRLWGIGADQRSLWLSTAYSDGLVPAFNELNIQTIDDAGEPFTGLANLFEQLLVYTKSKIFVIYGTGPALNGQNTDLSAPQRVPSPVGCIDPRSIVETPLGVMFQSQRGLELIAPNLQVSFIGSAVMLTTQTYPICTSAVHCPNSSTIRFTMVNSETWHIPAAGVIVIYDYLRSRWTIYSISQSPTLGWAAVDAPLESAVYHFALGYCAIGANGSNGTIAWSENTATAANAWADSVDNAVVWVPLKVQLGWLKQGDLQGWQRHRRIRVLGQNYDNHGLQVTCDYDYRATAEVHSFTDAQVANIAAGGYEQIRVTPGRNHSQSIRVTVQSTVPASWTTGRGGGFLGLAFEGARKKGGYRNIGAGAKA